MHPNDGRVVSNFVVQALKGEDITLYGDGQQTRSFCFVDDLVEGFLRFMDLSNENGLSTGFPGPVNLGNPNEFTIRQLAEKVIEITGSTSRLIYLPLPADDPMQRQPDITLAQTLLNGWKPQIELEQGLMKTIQYFDQLLSK
jgi:UDP-glucuronate decarboxylase